MQTNWKRTNLNGDWTLFYQPNSQYVQSGAHPTTMDDLCAQEGCISAVVPGNFEIDLQRAGRLEDPFFGQNVLKMQKLEAMHMFYGRRFEYHPTAGTTPVLTFEGLDTVAEIFLNGRRVGQCEQRAEIRLRIPAASQVRVHVRLGHHAAHRVRRNLSPGVH